MGTTLIFVGLVVCDGADTVRNVLHVPADMKLLFGISFGYPNLQAPANQARIGRDPLSDSVKFHD